MRKYTVGEYVEALKQRGIYISDTLENREAVIEQLSYDSRDVRPGALFICKGLHFVPEYLEKALAAGAAAYVAREQINGRGNAVIVSDIRDAMVCLARMFYNDPQRRLEMFGITGTKGKTTTTVYLRHILDLDASRRGARPCGIMNSTDMFDGVQSRAALITTPEAPDFWKFLSNGVENGLERFVCECSSQAFKYGRVAEVHFDIACITNVGSDHISAAEHPDWEDYFTSKLKIFDKCRVACVNLDDEHVQRTLAYVNGRRRTVTFGFSEEAEVRVSGVERTDSGIGFLITTPRESCRMKLAMRGSFNVKNAAAAVAMAYAAGIELETCRDALADIKIKGRMTDFISDDGRVAVLVDHAHNKLSFETLFDSVEEEYPGRERIVVFGWNGSKVYDRRRDVGTIAGKRAALTVICEWDSNDEPFEHIAAEAAGWIEKAGGRYVIVKDRAEAFRYAVNVPLEGEKRLVLFCGRGDEDFQRKGGKVFPYPEDVEITRQTLADYNKAHPVK